MQYPTHKAASLLHLHPVNLIYYLTSQKVSFNDVWPNLDESWIEIIRSHFGKNVSVKDKDNKKKRTDILDEDKPINLGISKNSALVVEKLYLTGKWGLASEYFEVIQELTQLSREELEASIEELKAINFIKRSKHNTYSLDQAKTSEIEHIIYPQKF